MMYNVLTTMIDLMIFFSLAFSAYFSITMIVALILKVLWKVDIFERIDDGGGNGKKQFVGKSKCERGS